MVGGVLGFTMLADFLSSFVKIKTGILKFLIIEGEVFLFSTLSVFLYVFWGSVRLVYICNCCIFLRY